MLVVNTYHHLDGRIAYFERVKRSLRRGGRLAIIEYREGGFPAGRATSPEAIQGELEAAGYARTASYDFLERQSSQMFTPSP